MLPKSIQNLIDEFSRLPGIGPKTAARLTFYLLTKSQEDVDKFGQIILNLRLNLKNCAKCFNIAESNPCAICDDQQRQKNLLCVVEEPLDIMAIEKTDYRGLYHVLGGVISPIDGIGPEHLRIKELIDRIKNQSVEELILATNPSLEGEATAIYISKQLQDWQSQNQLKITRIARGLPVGSDLEYADEVTLKRALEGRREY